MDDLDRELRELTWGRAGEPLFLEPSAAERARAGTVRIKEAPASGRRSWPASTSGAWPGTGLR